MHLNSFSILRGWLMEGDIGYGPSVAEDADNLLVYKTKQEITS